MIINLLKKKAVFLTLLFALVGITVLASSGALAIGLACGDGVDNDNDSLVDSFDPGCHTDGDVSNPSSYDPTKDTEFSGYGTCQAPMSSILGLENIDSIDIHEVTIFGSHDVYTLSTSSSDLVTDITQSATLFDFDTYCKEYYDVFISDADGFLDPNGSYLSIEIFRDDFSVCTGANNVGNNIDAVDLHLSDGSVLYADVVSSAVFGTRMSAGQTNAFGFADSALGAFDVDYTTNNYGYTRMGDDYSRITVGFCGALEIEPVCGDSTVDPGEQCDDGNTQDGDGCSNTCQNEPAVTQCSDSIDNDDDSLIDADDPGCWSDPTDPTTYDPTKDNENQKPVITIIGDNSVTLTVGGSFSDEGATAQDTEDGDITSDIVTSGDTVNTSVAGSYTINYDVVDSKGLAGDTKTRTVDVNRPPIGGCVGSCGTPVFPAPKLVITDETVTNLGGGVVMVTWKTDATATSRVVFGTTSIQSLITGNTYGYASSTSIINTLTKQHSVVIGGIVEDINYYFRPVSDNVPSVEVIGIEVSHLDSPEIPEEPPVILGTTTPPVVSCSYLLDYLKIGQDNNPDEVRKLKAFLKYFSEEPGLKVSGTFDQDTFDAVIRFQSKYPEDIMTPWGITEPTGYVYITTKKKINEMYCRKEFPLTIGQETEITDYKAWITQQKVGGVIEQEIDTSKIGDAGTTVEEPALIGLQKPVVPEFTVEQPKPQQEDLTVSPIKGEQEPDVELAAAIGELFEQEMTDDEDKDATAVGGFGGRDVPNWLSIILGVLVIIFGSLYLRSKGKKEPEEPEPLVPDMPQRLPIIGGDFSSADIPDIGVPSNDIPNSDFPTNYN